MTIKQVFKWCRVTHNLISMDYWSINSGTAVRSSEIFSLLNLNDLTWSAHKRKLNSASTFHTIWKCAGTAVGYPTSGSLLCTETQERNASGDVRRVRRPPRATMERFANEGARYHSVSTESWFKSSWAQIVNVRE